MVKINPDLLQYSPDDFSGMSAHTLLVEAGQFARKYRQLWITIYQEGVLIEQAELDMMDRLHHAFSVAIMCRKDEIMNVLRVHDIPMGNVDTRENAFLAASIYERRVNAH